MKYAYHFHAISAPSSGAIAHHDGVFHSDAQINSWESYRDVKKKIALAEGVRVDTTELTICSLSLIGTIES